MSAADFTRSGSPITATGFNNNVAATRAATINGTTGGVFSRNPMGDTTFAVSTQPRPIRDKKESRFAPMTLRVVNVGTSANPTYRKLVRFPDGSCDVAEGWAECFNKVYEGQETWAQDGTWYYITDADGAAEHSELIDQKKIEYAYLHVFSYYHENGPIRAAIVSNAQKIPADYDGLRDDCICVGRFTVPTNAEISKGIQPKVAEQYVTGQVQVYGSRFPFKLSVVNIGTDASPEWVKCFYWSEGSVFYQGDTYGMCRNDPFPGTTAGFEGLYLVAKPNGATGVGNVPLQENVEYAFLHVKKVGHNAVDFVVTHDDETIPDRFNGSEDYCCCLGRFSTPTPQRVRLGETPIVQEQFVSSQVQIAETTDSFPFELMFLPNGSSEELCVYLPNGCLQSANNGGIIGSLMGVDTAKCPAKALAGWYSVNIEGELDSPDNIYCHYDIGNNTFYVDNNHADANGNGFRIGTVEEVEDEETSQSYWDVTKQLVRWNTIGYGESNSLFPFKLRVVKVDETTYSYQVYAPSGSVCVTDFTASIILSVNAHKGDGWCEVSGNSGDVYAIGAVLYAVPAGSEIAVPYAAEYSVTTTSNVQAAIAAMGLTYDTARPWRYFKVKIGSFSGTQVSAQTAHGTLSFMAPMDPTESTGEDARIGALTVDGAMLKVKKTHVTPSGGEAYDAWTIEQLDSRLVGSGASAWTDEDAMHTLFNIFDFSEDSETGTKSATLSTDKLKYPADGEHSNTCFLTVDDDGYVVHGGNEQYDKLNLIKQVFSFDGGGEKEFSNPRLDTSKLSAEFSTGHGVQILGIPANEYPDEDYVQLIDGVPSEIVQVGMVGTPGSEVALHLNNIIAWDTGKIDESCIDFGEGITNITTDNLDDYAAEKDHTHGNINTDGVLVAEQEEGGEPVFVPCAEGKILTTGLGGIIQANDISWVPIVLEEEGITDLELLCNVIQTFDHEYDGSGTITSTLSTDKLRYTSDEHEGNCLLVVDDEGYVTHSGNDMYNAADALTTDYTENNNTIPYWKVDTSGTGVVYNTAGTISYKPLDAANGVAGLDANGKIAAARLPSYTSGKWMKTDSSGNISVTNEVPIAIDATQTGVFYNNLGSVSYKALGTASGTIAEGDHTHGILTSEGFLDLGEGMTGQEEGGIVFGGSGGYMTVDMFLDPGTNYTDQQVLLAIAGAFTYSEATGGGVTAKMPANSVQDDACSSGGDCLAYFDDNKQLSHMGNSGMTKSKLNEIDDSFDYTGAAKDWTDASLKHDKIKYSGSDPLSSPKMLGFASGTIQHGSVTLLDAAVLPLKSGEEGASASNAPVAVTLNCTGSSSGPGAEETDVQKIARIGTSGYAARADHVHTFWDNSTPQNMREPKNASDVTESISEDSEWTRGNTGVTIPVLCGGSMAGSTLTLYYKTLKFDRFGFLYFASRYNKSYSFMT